MHRDVGRSAVVHRAVGPSAVGVAVPLSVARSIVRRRPGVARGASVVSL